MEKVGKGGGGGGRRRRTRSLLRRCRLNTLNPNRYPSRVRWKGRCGLMERRYFPGFQECL